MSARRSVLIKCPKCHAEKEIDVPENLFTNKKFGLIKIQIEKNICCPHQFIAFYDKNGNIRGGEISDLTMEIKLVDENEEKLTLRGLLGKYGDYNMQIIEHALLIDCPIILLHTKYEHHNIAPAMNKFFNFFLPENYKSPFIFTWEYDLQYNKHPRTDSLVITADNYVETTPWPRIERKFEKQLLNIALDILDDESQMIVVQQETQKLFNKATHVKNILNENKDETIHEEKLIEGLEEAFQENFDGYMIDFILQILEFRFKVDISKIKFSKKSKKRRKH